jgi:alpha-glucosidase
VVVSLLTDQVVRVRLAPGGQSATRRAWTAVQAMDGLAPADVWLAERADGVELGSATLAVLVGAGGRVTVREMASGRVVVADGSSGGPAWDPADGSACWTKWMPDDERYYGFGERTGLLDKRGRRYTCWVTDRYEDQCPGTDELYLAIPFFLALNEGGQSYGLFLDNTYRSAFDLTGIDERQYRLEVAGGELDYYVIAGPEPARIVERFTALVGRQRLPPRWALGYHQARWSYTPAARVREVAAELRRRRLPADVIHPDIDCMDGYRVFTWDRERFPDPVGLIRDLAAQGFKLMAIVDPGVKYQPEGGYRLYSEGVERGYFLQTSREPDADLLRAYVWPGICVWPDFARPEVRAWWGEQYGALLDVDVGGILNDMNEPAMHDKPVDDRSNQRIEPPLDTPHGPAAAPTTHAEVHNVYAQFENQATDEALRRLRPDRRVPVLTRAGYAGVQRYAGVWTGDNASYWEHLEMSLPQLMNLGLSGVAFSGADIGGFFADCGPELFARWMQVGAFYPLARSHSAKGCADQEPWVWGERIEGICRQALELRYRLLPYFYTLLAEAARSGAPLLRPLFYEYPEDVTTHLLSDQALVGRDLLVAPVLRPGKTHREVYLPKGRWYEFHTGAVLNGPAHVLAAAPLDGPVPLYARGGSIIPSGPVMQWSDERPVDPLRWDVFPDARGEATGTLYEDDGVSHAYERGVVAISRVACRPAAGGQITVSAQREGLYTPAPRTVEVRLHGTPDGPRTATCSDDTTWRLAVW